MIYLDHAAATPTHKRVLAAMEPYFAEEFFNPSAAYLPACRVREQYEEAKNEIARAVGARGVNLVVCASASMANNVAAIAGAGVAKNAKGVMGEKIISPLEHASVYEACGDAEILRVDEKGMVDMVDFREKIDSTVSFVSVSLASNEIGTIQPIAEMSEIIKAERMRRLDAGEKLPIYFHTDATQALNVMEVSFARLGVDMMTISGAKIYGPKGAAGLIFNPSTVSLKPLVRGGGQENGIVSGTENVPSVVGFAVAMKMAREGAAGERKRLTELKGILREILAREGAVKFLGNEKRQLASHLPISVVGVDAERLIFKLEESGVLVSSGAACSANKGAKSKSLLAMGLSDAEIAGSLRLTLGKLNDEQNVREAGELILQAIASERRFAR